MSQYINFYIIQFERFGLIHKSPYCWFTPPKLCIQPVTECLVKCLRSLLGGHLRLCDRLTSFPVISSRYLPTLLRLPSHSRYSSTPRTARPWPQLHQRSILI